MVCVIIRHSRRQPVVFAKFSAGLFQFSFLLADADFTSHLEQSLEGAWWILPQPYKDYSLKESALIHELRSAVATLLSTQKPKINLKWRFDSEEIWFALTHLTLGVAEVIDCCWWNLRIRATIMIVFVSFTLWFVILLASRGNNSLKTWSCAGGNWSWSAYSTSYNCSCWPERYADKRRSPVWFEAREHVFYNHWELAGESYSSITCGRLRSYNRSLE